MAVADVVGTQRLGQTGGAEGGSDHVLAELVQVERKTRWPQEKVIAAAEAAGGCRRPARPAWPPGRRRANRVWGCPDRQHRFSAARSRAHTESLRNCAPVTGFRIHGRGDG